MRLSTRYYEHTRDSTLCTDPEWKKAIWTMINAIKYQQSDTSSMNQRDLWYYSFSRWTTQQTETLEDGIGIPGKRCGTQQTQMHTYIFCLTYAMSHSSSTFSLSHIFVVFKTTSCTDYESCIVASGMSRSPFRPSDDAHRNPYPVLSSAIH